MGRVRKSLRSLMGKQQPTEQKSHDTTPSTSQSHLVKDPSPPDNTSVPSFPDGVKVLHDNTDATVDICFVHGLTGNRESTWTADGQSTPWPKALLPSMLDHSRVLTYGYDAYIVRKSVASENRLLDHATNLLNDLTTCREVAGATSRPLIFVAHSLGGLVCKTAILRSRNNEESHLCDIFDSLKGIIFLGTPHKGAWMADWAKIPAFAIGLVKSTNKSLLEILETSSDYLEYMQVQFLGMVRQQREVGRRIEITCFFEEMPLPFAGQVVPKESASLEGYNTMSIHANHRDMVKFSSIAETGFQRLHGELNRWEAGAASIPSDLMTERKFENIRNACMKSLAFPDMESRFFDVDIADGGTCGWLSEHWNFKRWTASDQGLLWIKGKPGSGKSTLMKHILQKCDQVCGVKDSDLVLSFFFHGRGEQLQKSPLGLFRSLLHQVLHRAPDVLQDFLYSFERRHRAIGMPGKKWQWHQAELQQTFATSLPKALEMCPVWLFIDALDECGKEDAIKLVRSLGSLLRGLALLSNGARKLHICFTCRHYPILSLDNTLELCLEDENRQDIMAYVQDKLSGSRLSMAHAMRDAVSARANGVFLWACLVVDRALQLELEGGTWEEIGAVIYSIPQRLDELYRELFQSMKFDSLRLIQWICLATRPLNVIELQWALAVGPDCSHRSLRKCLSSEGDQDDARMIRQIRTLSCGLAEVVKSGAVQFIHQSVKDFLLEKGLLGLSHRLKSSNADSINEAIGMAHLQLSRTCIRYLMMEEIGQAADYESCRFPFLEYATTSWVHHTKQSEDNGSDPNDLLELFSWPSNDLVQLWVRIYQKKYSASYDDDRPGAGTDLVHVLSKYQIIRPLVRIIERSEEVGADIDRRDEEGRTPLWWATKKGQERAVKLLLNSSRVDVNSKDSLDQTPLLLAARRGNQAIVRLLLKADVKLDVQDKYGQTVFSQVAEMGNDVALKLFLETGNAKVNLADKYGRTALWRAANMGRDAVVKLLLEVNNAVVDSKDKFGQTPLSQAAERGETAVVKVLLDTGKAEINSKDCYGQTALSWAARYGREEVVKRLLETGKADLSLKDMSGRTALSWAAKFGQEGIVKLLLTMSCAEVAMEDDHGQTPHQLAEKNGHDNIVRLLVRGANDTANDTTNGPTQTGNSVYVAYASQLRRRRRADIQDGEV